jgi:hypothetical protein
MNMCDYNGIIGFHNACWKGHLNVVQFLVQKEFDMNASDDDGRTGFHYACSKGNLNVVQFLVQRGFDMYIGNNNGRPGFHLACQTGNLTVVQFLLQQGFDMNVADIGGKTGFHYACAGGCLNVVRFLLQCGFDVNVADIGGKTGFHSACRYRSFNVVRFFVQQGFEGIHERDFLNMTGLEILVILRGQYDVRGDKCFIPCLLLLIEAGVKLDEYYVFGKLLYAIQNRIIEITFMKQKIFEKWTGRIAQVITDFTMEPFINTSLHNLSQFLN